MKQRVISSMLLQCLWGQHSLQDVDATAGRRKRRRSRQLLRQKRERLSISIHGTTSLEQESEAVYPEVEATS